MALSCSTAPLALPQLDRLTVPAVHSAGYVVTASPTPVQKEVHQAEFADSGRGPAAVQWPQNGALVAQPPVSPSQLPTNVQAELGELSLA